MRPTLLLTASIVAVFAASFHARARLESRDAGPAPPDVPRRILSMAPSVTETLFALGLGDRVVGVTDYCRFPPEAARKPKIGGFHNPNYEAVVALRPDLAVTLAEQQPARDALTILRVPVVTVSHQTLDGILDSIPALGRACGAEDRAETLAAGIRARLDAVAALTAGRPRPRVLVVVARSLDAGRPESIVVAGADGHLDRIVELSGGRNALEGSRARFPLVSTEGLLQIDPDAIVDLAPEAVAAELGIERLAADWRSLDRLRAVAAGRVYVVADDHASIPGPNFVMLVEKLAAILHPETQP